MNQLKHKALNYWVEFEESKKKYFHYKRHRNYFHVNLFISSLYEFFKNVYKYISSIPIIIKELIRFQPICLESLKLTVLRRDELYENAKLRKLCKLKHNRKVAITFASEELYREVLARHWIMI